MIEYYTTIYPEIEKQGLRKVLLSFSKKPANEEDYRLTDFSFDFDIYLPALDSISETEKLAMEKLSSALTELIDYVNGYLAG